jgi:hypothetical protein
MRRNREDYIKRYNWENVNTTALEIAIKLNVPENIKPAISTRSRKRDVMEWRSACIIAFWLNNETTEEATARYNREHSTIHNLLENLDNEFCGYASYNLDERIRLINYYAKNRVAYCDEDNIQIGDLVVYYRSEFEPADEECGVVGGWAVDIVEVHGIVESEHLKGGVIEVPINEYDEQSLINAIKNKL